jgi:hypothetical protein
MWLPAVSPALFTGKLFSASAYNSPLNTCCNSDFFNSSRAANPVS